MVAIASGLWRDHSRPGVEALTLTLPWDVGNILLSGLTVLVTIAGASFWNVTAFLLHTLLILRSARTDRAVSAVQLQHRVILRNTSGPLGTAWEALKIHSAWQSTRAPRLWARTLAVICPAVLIRAGFAAAALLVSRVASRANGSVVARVQPENCGWWVFDSDSVEGQTAGRIKRTNDTILARTYVSNFYANTTVSSTATSLFVRPTLPYTTDTSAACPIPASEHCVFGVNGAFGMKTGMLDSQEHLGINAPPEDRVGLQISATCSQIDFDGLRVVGNTSMAFTFGAVAGGSTNVTYSYYLDTELGLVGYLLVPRISYAGDNSIWAPIPEFNRTDADVSVFFLSQNAISYLAPVRDRFFLATDEVKISDSASVFRPNGYVHVMVCAEQYVVCNPTNAACTAPGGWYQLRDAILGSADALGWNSAAQATTAGRLLLALIDSNLFSTVEGLGAGALWAASLASMNISPGLPDNQWQVEALGWFQTSLAKIQAYMVDYASNAAGLSPYGTFQSAYGGRSYPTGSPEDAAALQDQCANQLVRSGGGVQNFNFVGVLLVAGFSVFLVLLDLALPRIASLVARYWHWGSAVETARRADANLYLLRLALGGPDALWGSSGWRRGRWDVPVLNGDLGLSSTLRVEEEQGQTEDPVPAASVGVMPHKAGG